MARRTKDEAEQTRSAILDAAERVFYRGGVARASLQEVAEDAGVTRGAVYWHFRNKIELLDAMAQRVLLPQEDILDQLAASDTRAPLEDLHRACRDGLKLMMNDPQRRRVFTILTQRCEYIEEMAPVMERRAACKGRMLDRFVRLFLRAQTLKQLAPGWPPRVAASTLQALMSGLIVNGLEGKPGRTLDRANAACLAAFFRTLGR